MTKVLENPAKEYENKHAKRKIFFREPIITPSDFTKSLRVNIMKQHWYCTITQRNIWDLCIFYLSLTMAQKVTE